MQSRIATSIIQRRLNRAVLIRRSFTADGRGQPPLDDVTCAGIDGSPAGLEIGRKEEDDKEYFSHHKPSALSEIEVADTRKPITKATDETAAGSESVGYFGDGNVVGWLPEQLETAEQTMMRAAEIWERNRMCGDPEAPHSRVLRALCSGDTEITGETYF